MWQCRVENATAWFYFPRFSAVVWYKRNYLCSYFTFWRYLHASMQYSRPLPTRLFLPYWISSNVATSCSGYCDARVTLWCYGMPWTAPPLPPSPWSITRELKPNFRKLYLSGSIWVERTTRIHLWCPFLNLTHIISHYIVFHPYFILSLHSVCSSVTSIYFTNITLKSIFAYYHS